MNEWVDDLGLDCFIPFFFLSLPPSVFPPSLPSSLFLSTRHKKHKAKGKRWINLCIKIQNVCLAHAITKMLKAIWWTTEDTQKWWVPRIYKAALQINKEKTNNTIVMNIKYGSAIHRRGDTKDHHPQEWKSRGRRLECLNLRGLEQGPHGAWTWTCEEVGLTGWSWCPWAQRIHEDLVLGALEKLQSGIYYYYYYYWRESPLLGRRSINRLMLTGTGSKQEEAFTFLSSPDF